jgi:hypothetical protein
MRNGDRLFDAVMQDQPVTLPVSVDYGIDGWGGTDPVKIYHAYQWAVRIMGVTAEQLNKAVGDGKKLSELIGQTVKTAWDDMGSEE